MKLQSIIITTDAGERAPRRVKLFTNRCGALHAVAIVWWVVGNHPTSQLGVAVEKPG